MIQRDVHRAQAISLLALRLGLNMFFLGREAGGAGRYARELTGALLSADPGLEITAFTSREPAPDLAGESWASEVEWVRLPARIGGPPGHVLVELAVQTGWIGRAARRRRLQLVHGLANVAPLVSPGFATVVTVLDLLWLRQTDVLDRRSALASRLSTFSSAKRATRVIAISEWVKGDVVQRIGLDPARVDAVPLAVADKTSVDPLPEAELRDRFELGPGPIVLCVAQKRRHKNLTGLVRAISLSSDHHSRLVVPGPPTEHEAELRTLARELNVSERVSLLGYVDEPELEGLYRAATCVVLPSFEEGFGLPILEAMRRRVPVACSRATSLPEVAGDAALYFDPHRPGDIARAVDRLVAEPELRADLAERGARRASAFTWERTARLTLEVYRRALNGASEP